MKSEKNRFRLDRTIEPLHYDLHIAPDLEKFDFSGSVRISIRAHKSFEAVSLHSVALTISRAAILPRSPHPQTVPAAVEGFDKELETVRLKPARRLPAGDYTLEIDFSGKLNEHMHGFYRTRYSVNGAQRWGAATQFEATDARRCFPCWDEPDRKATFSVTLTVPKTLTALSNMPALKQTASGDRKTLRYAKTPRMSTYLLAFVIADLECVRGRDANGVPIAVWTTPGRKHQGRFALKVAQHALPYFGRWFGIPYALPKLDMVALPDFASGAMENWGLITYRETALLVDPQNSSSAARQRVAEVVDHELAHQWFGNLVTMAWWTDLWLNEGFASYMGPKAVHDQFPEWDIWGQWVAGEYRQALRDDSLKSTHPIEIPVKNPSEIREIFDAITYSKGSAVNRMLEHYLGERLFRSGLRRYLKRYAYGNAATADLWTALEEVSGRPVRRIMASFTKQGGYPVVTAAPADRKRGLRVSQERFLADGARSRGGEAWTVPLVIASAGRRKPVEYALEKASGTVAIPEAAWLKLNHAQSGFYRVAYAPELFAQLLAAADAGKLGIIDTLGLLEDAFALARAGRLRTLAVLEIAARCGRFEDYNLWSVLADILASLENLIGRSAAFDAWARSLFAPLAARCGWNARRGESHLQLLLRPLALARAGHHGDAAVLDQARERFTRFAGGGDLDPNLRGAIYALIAESGSVSDFDSLLRIYDAGQLQEERVRILRALTRFRDPEVIERVLKLALSEKVRSQDAFIVFGGFGSNDAARARNWEFVREHWQALVERYAGGGLGLINHIIDGATRHFTTDEAFESVRSFFTAHPTPGTERSMRQAIESIGITLRWKKRDGAAIEGWLNRAMGAK